MKLRKNLSLLLVAALLLSMVAGLATSAVAADKPIKVGISLPTQREERWVQDKEGFEAAAAAAGIEALIQIADNDAGKQQTQCENLITQGIDVLIVAPHDGEAAKNIVEMAHEENIPVISYDRLILNADVDLYVTFDQFYIGQLMGEYLNDNLESGNIVVLAGDPLDNTSVPLKAGAMSAIQGKIDSGAYKVVLEQECKDWQASEALKHAENALTATDNDIQGFIAPNDGTAGGVIQALAAQGLEGKVIITGQDCEDDAVKRIIEGTQSMTVFFDTAEMSAAAFEAALTLAKGEEIVTSLSENNGKIDVPVLGFPAKAITKDNYKELLIDSGLKDEAAFK